MRRATPTCETKPLHYARRCSSLRKTRTPQPMYKRALALAREAAWRVLQLRAYDATNFVGGHATSTGALAEMATGEGKTLAAVAPTLLGALRGKGALVVTANDYLARRDADSVGLVFRFWG